MVEHKWKEKMLILWSGSDGLHTASGLAVHGGRLDEVPGEVLRVEDVWEWLLCWNNCHLLLRYFSCVGQHSLIMLAGAKRPRKDCGRGSGEERPADSDIQGNFFRFYKIIFWQRAAWKTWPEKIDPPKKCCTRCTCTTSTPSTPSATFLDMIFDNKCTCTRCTCTTSTPSTPSSSSSASCSTSSLSFSLSSSSTGWAPL